MDDTITLPLSIVKDLLPPWGTATEGDPDVYDMAVAYVLEELNGQA